jgi:hemoglobin
MIADGDPRPTLYEAAGGALAMRRLAEAHYARCLTDPVLQQVFGTTGKPDHAAHLAAWLGEVFGGPPAYTDRLGGFPEMLRHHVGLAITEEQRAAFVAAFAAALDAAGIPTDAVLRERLLGYVDWGSHVALRNSQPGYEADVTATVPSWDWGDEQPGN